MCLFIRYASAANETLQLAYGTGTAWMKSKSADLTKIDKPLVEAIKMAIGLGYYHIDGAEGLCILCKVEPGTTSPQTSMTSSVYLVAKSLEYVALFTTDG